MNVKVGLVQVDGKWPNLALRKLQAFHKSNGDEMVVPLNANRIYLSCIFTWNKSKALGMAQFFRSLVRFPSHIGILEEMYGNV